MSAAILSLCARRLICGILLATLYFTSSNARLPGRPLPQREANESNPEIWEHHESSAYVLLRDK
jgi:hypothetical protein